MGAEESTISSHQDGRAIQRRIVLLNDAHGEEDAVLFCNGSECIEVR